jgi:uncharacterized oligopeptide transporter (OPT) family protein
MSETAAEARVYPELTWTAVIVGWILGVIIAISIGYAALILGFSIEGSELAAILGFGILRGVLRRKSIIEILSGGHACLLPSSTHPDGEVYSVK